MEFAGLRPLNQAFWTNWQRLGAVIGSVVWTSCQRWMWLGGWDRLVAILLILLILLGRPTESLAATLGPIAWEAPIGTINKPNVENIPAEKIDQFVHAYQQVLALIQQRQGELQAAETESLEKGLQREIEATAIGLIEQTGLTRQEYFQLLGLVSVDAELGDTIAILLQESPQ